MSRKQPKKVSPYRRLQQDLIASREMEALSRRLLGECQAETVRLRRQLAERVDTAMMQERIKLANALGQLMHTSCEAVKYVIGKEVM